MSKHVYRVTLLEPHDGKYDFYFSTIAAIFKSLNFELLGVRKESLWSNHDFSIGAYQNKLCTIRREPVLKGEKRGCKSK